DRLPPCGPSHRGRHQTEAAAAGSAFRRETARLTMGRLFVHGGGDRIEDVEELLPLGGRENSQRTRIRGTSTRVVTAEAFPSLLGEVDGVRPAILLGALAMNEPSRQQSRHNIGEG